jgi:hypothetical protein
MMRFATLTVVAALAAIASAAAAAAASPARYACYPAQFSSWHAQSRTLADKLAYARDSTTVSIDAPESVCAPALGSSTGYLTCYRVKPAGPASPASYTVTDEFTKFSAALQALATVCVPSTRVDRGGSASAPSTKSLFSCYAAKAAPPARSDVSVTDPFGTSKDSLAAPLRLCSPAGWKAPAPDGSYLSCYSDRASTTGTIVILRNEFGYLKAALGPRAWLCTTASVAGGSGLVQAYAGSVR